MVTNNTTPTTKPKITRAIKLMNIPFLAPSLTSVHPTIPVVVPPKKTMNMRTSATYMEISKLAAATMDPNKIEPIIKTIHETANPMKTANRFKSLLKRLIRFNFRFLPHFLQNCAWGLFPKLQWEQGIKYSSPSALGFDAVFGFLDLSV